MNTMTRRMSAAAAFAVAMTASLAWAQQTPPTVRVRGEITKVDGPTLSIKARDGQDHTVKLADNARITALVKASLADIKTGAFIGVTAMPQPDGSQKAIGIHIFLDSQKGVVADRHMPWDREPGSTMTNANVESTAAGVDGQTVMVKYKDGEKKVIVPPNTPIAAYAPGDQGDLKPGAKIFIIAAQKQPDGSLVAPAINVGRDGVAPPM
jgi:hypothetical protein